MTLGADEPCLDVHQQIVAHPSFSRRTRPPTKRRPAVAAESARDEPAIKRPKIDRGDPSAAPPSGSGPLIAPSRDHGPETPAEQRPGTMDGGDRVSVTGLPTGRWGLQRVRDLKHLKELISEATSPLYTVAGTGNSVPRLDLARVVAVHNVARLAVRPLPFDRTHGVYVDPTKDADTTRTATDPVLLPLSRIICLITRLPAAHAIAHFWSALVAQGTAGKRLLSSPS